MDHSSVWFGLQSYGLNLETLISVRSFEVISLASRLGRYYLPQDSAKSYAMKPDLRLWGLDWVVWNSHSDHAPCRPNWVGEYYTLPTSHFVKHKNRFGCHNLRSQLGHLKQSAQPASYISTIHHGTWLSHKRWHLILEYEDSVRLFETVSQTTLLADPTRSVNTIHYPLVALLSMKMDVTIWDLSQLIWYSCPQNGWSVEDEDTHTSQPVCLVQCAIHRSIQSAQDWVP